MGGGCVAGARPSLEPGARFESRLPLSRVPWRSRLISLCLGFSICGRGEENLGQPTPAPPAQQATTHQAPPRPRCPLLEGTFNWPRADSGWLRPRRVLAQQGWPGASREGGLRTAGSGGAPSPALGTRCARWPVMASCACECRTPPARGGPSGKASPLGNRHRPLGFPSGGPRGLSPTQALAP